MIARFVRPRPVICAEWYSALDRCDLKAQLNFFMQRFSARPKIAAVPILAALFVFLQNLISVDARNLPSAVLSPWHSIPERRYSLLSNNHWKYVFLLLSYTPQLFFWSAIIYEPYSYYWILRWNFNEKCSENKDVF